MSEPDAKVLRIAMVAGESSGDTLGAGLIREIRRNYPNAYCYGIGGPLMQAEGFKSFYPMERLSVMGLVEVLGRLGELLGIHRQLGKILIGQPPDVFIGIDAPDFNLSLEKKLKSAGIATAHYVSPQVWAWREWRLKKIKKSVDHMLALLPFEVDYYRAHNIPVTFIGHPLADQIPMHIDSVAARRALGVSGDMPIIGLLPGSRKLEVRRLAKLFLDTARLLKKEMPDAQFIIPCANDQREREIITILESYHDLNVMVLTGQAQAVMAASDAMLIASGTAVLEGALHKKPMVVSYKLSSISYAVLRLMVKIKYCSLPNIIAGRELVPELIQDKATPELLLDAMKKALYDQPYRHFLEKEFTKIHQMLQQKASVLAFKAINSLIRKTGDHATK